MVICNSKEILHDEHQWCQGISQMLESTHDNSEPVEYQLKLPDNPRIAEIPTFKQNHQFKILGDINNHSTKKTATQASQLQ